MTMPATDWLKDQIRAHLLRSATWAKPAELWVALYSAAPTAAGGGTELNAAGYARVRHGPGDYYWTAPVDGWFANASKIQFGVPLAPWAGIEAAGLLSAASGGILYAYDTFAPIGFDVGGGAPHFLPGKLRLRLSASA